MNRPLTTCARARPVSAPSMASKVTPASAAIAPATA